MPNVALIEIVTLHPFFAICTGLAWNPMVNEWDVWGKWTHMVDFL